MTLTPATFYDDNGVVRLQGQLDGGGGVTPDLAAVLVQGGDPDGNPITGLVEIDGTSVVQDTMFKIVIDGHVIFACSWSDQSTILGSALHVDEHGATVLLDGSSLGFVIGSQDGMGGELTVSESGSLALIPAADSPDPVLDIRRKDNAVAIFVAADDNTYIGTEGTRFDKAGRLVSYNHTAPADGEIGAGECAIWFDQTNGAGNTKLMLKGKSADGTVKTAAILLT